jgi:hypothetical protein
LASDASLAALVAQFVPVSVDVGSPDFRKWAERLGLAGQITIPYVSVLRADGEKLYADSGAPQGDALPALLRHCLENAGKVLDEKKLERMSEALEAALKLAAEGNDAAAIDKIAKLVGSGCYAEAAVNLDAFAKQLAEKALARAAEAEELLGQADAEQVFAGALALCETLRVYGKLPAVKADVAARLKKLRSKAETRAVLQQAEALDRAVVTAARQPKRAVAAFQQVIHRFPDSPAAKLAQQRLDELSAQVGHGDSPQPSR